MEICVGVDFGGNKSGHAFVATAKTHNYKDLILLKSDRWFGELVAADLERLIIDFIGAILSKYGPVDYVYWDNAETVLGRGIKVAIGNKCPSIIVRPALKCAVNDRIRCTTMLMGNARFWVCDECQTVKDALSDAVWDEKQTTKDERLDDGSTDIDSLDAMEYTFERNMKQYINLNHHR